MSNSIFYNTSTNLSNFYTINSNSIGSNGNNPYVFSNTYGSNPAMNIKGDLEVEGEIKINGKDLSTILEAIEDRLLILMPDPKKLEKYESLRKAYNHYKLMEKLINED